MLHELKFADLEAELRESLLLGQDERARALLADLHPADIADLLDVMDEDLRVRAFSLLENEIASEVLDEAQTEATLDLVEAVPDERLADLLEELPMDDAAELLGDLPPEQAASLIALMEPEDAAEVRSLLKYRDETAGRLMTEKVVRIRRRWTAQATIEYLRGIHPETETLAYLYAVDDEDRLVGVVPLRALITAPANTLVRDIMEPDVISVTVDTDQEEVARLVAKYDFFAIPVVDREGRLAGIITHDDVLDILEEEFTEDVQRLGGSEPLDRPYFALSIPQMARKRVGWLLLLFVAETFTGSVLRLFKGELEAVVALSFFIPLLIGTGGNAGSQTVTTVIRALALGEVRLSDALRVLGRELSTGLVVGTLLGIVGFGRALLWGTGIPLALVIALTLPAICIWANTVGSLVPLAAEKAGIDPTVVSAPFISTVVDATGLFIYFSIARVILGL